MKSIRDGKLNSVWFKISHNAISILNITPYAIIIIISKHLCMNSNNVKCSKHI